MTRNAFVAQLLGHCECSDYTLTPGYLVYNARRGAGASHEAALAAVHRMNKPGSVGVSPTGETGTMGDPLLSPIVPATDGDKTER